MYDNDYEYNMNLERRIQNIYTKASKSKYMNWSCSKCKIKAVVLKDNFDYKCTECFYQEDKQPKQKNIQYKKEIDNSIEHIIYTKEVFTNLTLLFKIDDEYIYLTNQRSDVEIDFNNIFNKNKSINKIICTINSININELKNIKSIFLHFILNPKLSIFSINEPMEKIHHIVDDNCEIIWETTSEYIQDSKVIIYWQN